MPLSWIGRVIIRASTKEDIDSSVVTIPHRNALASDRDGHPGDSVEERRSKGLMIVDVLEQSGNHRLELLIVARGERHEQCQSQFQFHENLRCTQEPIPTVTADCLSYIDEHYAMPA